MPLLLLNNVLISRDIHNDCVDRRGKQRTGSRTVYGVALADFGGKHHE